MPVYRGDQLTLIPLETPAAPTLTRRGTAGETTYTYKVVAIRTGAHTEASEETSITDGFATLSAAHYVEVKPPYVQAATSFDIYRTAGGASQGKIGSLVPSNMGTVQRAVFRDRGQTAAEGDPPDNNNTGILYLPGIVSDSMLAVDDTGAVVAQAPSTQSYLRTATVPLSAADVLGMTTSSFKTLIAAPGANRVISPVGMIQWIYTFGTVAYQSTGTGCFNLGVGSANIITSCGSQTNVLYSQDVWLWEGVEVMLGGSNNALATFVDQPFLLGIVGGAAAGTMLTTTLASGGAGYVAGNQELLLSGANDGVVEVDTVDGGGAVLTYHVIAAGTGYVTTANPVATTPNNGGVGTGLTLNVTSVTQGDGTFVVTLLYYVIDTTTGAIIPEYQSSPPALTYSGTAGALAQWTDDHTLETLAAATHIADASGDDATTINAILRTLEAAGIVLAS